MLSEFHQLLSALPQRQDTVLVTIIWENGSTPRGAGSQMLVGQHGLLSGTIGGGAVELRSLEMAQTLLREKRSGCHTFTLRKNPGEDIGMVCGGDVTVLFQYIDASLPFWHSWKDLLLSRTAAGCGGWLIFRRDGSLPSLLDLQGQALLGEPVLLSLPASGCFLTESFFAMPLPVGERAVIFGGGHVTQALVPLLHSVGFRVTVMDCRPEFADPRRFPEADTVLCGDYLRIADSLTLTEEDYVVVMTSGHSHDFEVQNQVLRGPFAYIGVIGSRTKTAAVNQRLRDSGIPEESIRKVHAPIGTAIKAVTPAEIAVSITGEMICHRATLREQTAAAGHACPMR